MISLPDKIILLHQSLAVHEIPHAFGGALALAWCTQQARGTVDIDINIFVTTEKSGEVFNGMPEGVLWSEKDLEVIMRDGQVRLWWEKTPIDIFLNTMNLHEEMSRRCRWESFLGESVPFLSCHDLAVLKVFFDRTKDWADLEAMQAAGTLNVPRVAATIIEYLGADDERIQKLTALSVPTG